MPSPSTYTSGTTGNPKGVVYHHRGATINAISNVLEWDVPKHAVYPVDPAHVPLQWLVLPVDGGGACRRQRLPAPRRGQAIFDTMRKHGVTHYCSAPIVHGLLVNAPAAMKASVPAGIKWWPAPRRRPR